MTLLHVSAAYVDGQLVPGDVDISDGIVARVGIDPESRQGDLVAIPGLVDAQVNGFAGVDFLKADADGWRSAAVALAASGVTSYVATLITSPTDVVDRALAVARSILDNPPAGGARLLGVHLEGPFLSPERPGTHPVEYLREPDVALMDAWLASGCITTVTLAPERPGALRLIEHLVSNGVAVSLGHSNTDARTAHQAVDCGATGITHAFNAMSTPRARDAGLAGVALVRQELQVQLICDGAHLSDDIARLIMGTCRGRFALVSDVISAGGMGPGHYSLGSVQVEVRDGTVRRQDGTLAGSAAPLATGLANALRLGIGLADVAAATSRRPAAFLGIGLADVAAATSRRPAAFLGIACPQLRVGDPADIVVLAPDHTIQRVLLRGNDVRD
jgi:N-acetylglucosamine-6-phosphate deacetylase